MTEQKAVPFTQYLRPNGTKRPAEIYVEPDVWEKAQQLIKADYRFSVEELTTGHVSMTCEGPARNEEEEIHLAAIQVCANGPPVVAAVNSLIANAHAQVREEKKSKRKPELAAELDR